MKEDHHEGQHDSDLSGSAYELNKSEYQDMNTKKRSLDSAADTQVTCSHCRKPFNRSESKVMPFCSVRCQQIDLGRWLDEEYGMPMEGQEDREFGLLEESELDDNTE